MSTPAICHCGSCDGTQNWHNNRTSALLRGWKHALHQARNGFDEVENNVRAAELAVEIRAELDRCGNGLVQQCSEYGLYADEPVNVGQRDFGR